ncbi:MAG: NAD(P)/FAD-dependent oxidoreductase [Proteobacteria bacterium]|jgi:protoporphyrinogen oxidase|nr:NAD(P)/FAD-dependent oxidoreductase [Pseudomonadota bacterium]
MNPKRVAVIGAGVMGLACAYELLKKGHAVDIYEADDRVGGMSAHFDFDGLSLERFYHFVCKPDQTLFEYLDELGLSDKLRWVPTKMGYFYEGQLYSWGNPVALLTFPRLSLLSKLRYGIHMFYCTKISNWQKLDHRNAVEWIKRWIGEPAYQVLWDGLFKLKFHHYADNLSAAWIWARIKRVGQSRRNLMQEEMGYIEGGSETLLKALENKIADLGGTMRLSTPVSEITRQEDNGLSLTVADEALLYDRVISTVPLPFVPRLIPELSADVQAKYKSVNNLGVACVIYKLRKPVTENFWLNVNDPEMAIPGIIEYSNLRQMDHSIVYVPYYLPREHDKFAWTNAQFIDEATAYLKRINPELTDDDFIAIHVSRYGFAQPICEPGFPDRLPPIRSEWDGLYIADTSYYYPEDRSISESMRLGKQLAEMVAD